MANPVCEVLLTEAPLQAPDGLHYGSGAIVDFFGAVRPSESGREISGIEYEAHKSMALHQLEQIAREAIEKFRLNCVIVHHRTGFVASGEASVFVRTTSRNRIECYQANQWMLDELKKKVPIWKRPHFVPSKAPGSVNSEPVSSI